MEVAVGHCAPTPAEVVRIAKQGIFLSNNRHNTSISRWEGSDSNFCVESGRNRRICSGATDFRGQLKRLYTRELVDRLIVERQSGVVKRVAAQ